MQFPTPLAEEGSGVFSGYGDQFSRPSPTATLDGIIEPTAPGWDPYATAAPESAPLLPPGGMLEPNANSYPDGGLIGPRMDGTQAPRLRLLHQIGIENSYLARFSHRGFGVDDVGLYASFSIPFLYNPSPLFITPGFTYHSWNGPDSDSFRLRPDLPANAYDAYLDTVWRPVITTWLSADLGVRIGVYSDFNRVNNRSIRIIGRGLGVITLSERWQVTAGVWYLDRLRVKVLPAGGVIWTPNPDTRFEMVFPNPKLAQRITNFGNAEIWGYLSGEYGGGKWTIQRANGMADEIDYNDIRAIAGLEYRGFQRVTGYFEVGYVFSRQLLFRGGTPDTKPSDTVMLRAGVSF